MGSAEDKIIDGGLRYAKIRPMRVEMHLYMTLGATPVRTGNPCGLPTLCRHA